MVHSRIRLNSLLLSGVLTIAGGCANRSSHVTVREPSLGISQEANSSAGDATKTQSADDTGTLVNAARTPWQFGDQQGFLISSPNYRIYTTVEDERVLQQLPVFYERALEHYTSALANLPKPRVPLETFLFQTRSQWQVKTQEMLPDQATMFSNLGRGGFTTKGTSVLYYIDRWVDQRGYPRDTFAIAAHEGWHQYTQQTFKHQLPIWLEEGVATYMEGYRVNRDRNAEPEFHAAANFERRETLRDALRSGRLIPLDDILTRSPQSFLNESKETLLTYYAQVWAMIRFLAEGEDGRYKSALNDVLLDAAEGRLVGRMMNSQITAGIRRRSGPNRSVGPAVAQEYFNRDLSVLETQYRAFIDQIIASEGRGPGRR